MTKNVNNNPNIISAVIFLQINYRYKKMVLKKLNNMNYKLYNILLGITFRVTENFLKNIISVQQNNSYLEKIQQLTEIISTIPKPLTLQNIREHGALIDLRQIDREHNHVADGLANDGANGYTNAPQNW